MAGKFRLLRGGLLFFGVWAIFSPVYLILLSRKKWLHHAHYLRKVHTRWVIRGAGIKPMLLHADRLDPDQAVVYAPNHFSYLDILLLLAVLPGNFGFVGKIELIRNPVLRYFFGRTDIAIKRQSLRHSSEAFEKAARFLRNGWSVVIFPEGGIRGTAPDLAPLKNGAFKLAAAENVPLVPVIMPDNFRLLPDGVPYLKSGTARAVIGHPLHPDQFDSTDALKEKTFYVVQDELKRLLNASASTQKENAKS